MGSMLKLIKLVKPLIAFMLLAVALGIVGQLMATFIPILAGYALLDTGRLFPVFITIVVFGLLRGAFRYGEQLSNHYIAFKLLAEIRDKVFKALRRLAPTKLESKDKGNLVTLITSDVELLEVFYAHTISPVLIGIGTSIFMTVFIGRYSLWLGLVAILSYLSIGLFLPIYFSKKNKNNGEEYQGKSGDLSSYLLESLRGVDEVIQFQNGNKRLEGIEKKTEKLINTEEKLKVNLGKNNGVLTFLITSFVILNIVVSFYLYSIGSVSFEGVLICFLALTSSFGSVSSLAVLGTSLQKTIGAAKRIVDLLEEEPVVKDVVGKTEIGFSGLSCENIYFSYDKKRVLDDLSLNIKKGDIIGLQGKSGTGKSTLIKLLMRFWNIDKGNIEISDVKIGCINTSNLRGIESYMTQDVELFNDSIKNNLKIANFDASYRDIVNACKKASIHKFISSLPRGYETSIGELGDRLSGGEKQRLSLARAFLHNGDFMLLDEPTSNLDILNEAIILKSLKNESEDKTILISSHRNSTMKVADKIHFIKGGKMAG